MKIAVIGGGITGLTAGYQLSKNGHQITIFEKENQIGGLVRGFKKREWAWSLDFFFHHLFTSDDKAINLLKEIGLSQNLFFSQPKTSIFFDGSLSQFDSPASILKFPHLTFLDKIRTGIITFWLKYLADWQKLESITADHWLQKYYGRRVFRVIWQPLLSAKFGQEAKNISMAWLWARIKKRSASLGYLGGGFQTLTDTLVKEIEASGGQIVLDKDIKNPVKLLSEYDKVIKTTPLKFPFRMLGALNLVLILKNKFLTDNTYWLNINEPGFPFVAVVEHTNFVSQAHFGNHHVLYIGGYYPQNHRYFKMTKEAIFKEFLPFLKKINPSFNFKISSANSYLSMYLNAQPIVPINYSKMLAQIKNPPGFFQVSMQTIYPWDRGINYAVEEGLRVANEISKNTA